VIKTNMRGEVSNHIECIVNTFDGSLASHIQDSTQVMT